MFTTKRIRGVSRFCNSCGNTATVQLITAVMPKAGTDDDKPVTTLVDLCDRDAQAVGVSLVRRAGKPTPKTKTRKRS